ncbi:MAG: type II secretion system protein GspK [Methylococcaceae bacterium]|nr:type II secretion system protein GspK [Methylococcaceae bacterium]
MKVPICHAGQRGVAMIAVLWMVTLLTIMAGSFSLSMQRNTGLVKNAQDRARGLALADAGVHYAMLMLSLPDPQKRWRSDGMRYEVKLPGGDVVLTIFDEGGKIDINAASEQTLRDLLIKVVGNDPRSLALADRILDWRDSDNLRRANGAEDKDYLAEGRAYVPQNKNFQSLEELQMVLGMTPALYKKLEPLLTIYTGQDGINPLKASAEVLRLLLGLDEKTIADYLSQRRANQANLPPPTLSTPTGGIRVAGGGDIAYTIFAQARLSEGQGAGLKVTVRRQRSRNGTPFAFVSWKQQIFGANDKFDAANFPMPR